MSEPIDIEQLALDKKAREFFQQQKQLYDQPGITIEDDTDEVINIDSEKLAQELDRIKKEHADDITDVDIVMLSPEDMMKIIDNEELNYLDSLEEEDDD